MRTTEPVLPGRATLRRAAGGMTLIEVLVAISIFAVVIAAVTPALLSNVALTQKSREQSERTLSAQAVLEKVRMAWRDPNAYALGCVPSLTLPAGVQSLQLLPLTYQIGAEDPASEELTPGAAVNVGSCAASSPVASAAQLAAAPNMRRVVVTTLSGTAPVQTIMDVVQP